jgi:hypothetical protein
MVGYVDIGVPARPEVPVTSFADAFRGFLGATGRLKMDPKTFDVRPTVPLTYADFTDIHNQPYTPEEIRRSIGDWKVPETMRALVVQGNPVTFPGNEIPSVLNTNTMEGFAIVNNVPAGPGAEPLNLGALDITEQLNDQLGDGTIKVARIIITPDRKVEVKSIPSVDQLISESSGGSSAVSKPSETGGIDFNSAMLGLQIHRDGAGVPLPVSNQPIGEMNIQGFVPVILNIQTAPAAPMPFTLGGAQQSAEELSRVADY